MAGTERVAMANPSIAAYHEAGHAVMAMLCGIRVLRVTLKFEYATLGATETDDAPRMAHSQAERELLEKHVLVSLAGSAAQSRVNPASLELMFMDSGDRDAAAGLLRLLLSEDATEERITELTESWMERAVEHIAGRTVWRAVETIATELQEKYLLSGAEVQRLFDGSMGDT
jgi:ATP-dependent Zn protease